MTNARWQRWLVAWHGVLVLVWLQGFWQRSVPLALAGLVAVPVALALQGLDEVEQRWQQLQQQAQAYSGTQEQFEQAWNDNLSRQQALLFALQEPCSNLQELAEQLSACAQRLSSLPEAPAQ